MNLEHARKNPSNSPVFYSLWISSFRKATADDTAESGRSHLSAQQVRTPAQKSFAGAEGREGTFC